MNNMSEKSILPRRVFIGVVLIFALVWLSGAFTVKAYANGGTGREGNRVERTAESDNSGGSGNLANDKVVTGTKKLIQDAMLVGQAIGALICVLFAVYFFARKAGADEQDQKMWKNRIVISIVSAIGIVTVGGIIGTIVSYYV